MIKPIILYGNPILRYSADFYKEKEDVSEIIKDLWDTMYNVKGMGLAAPQIGISKKIFVVDVDLPNENLKQVFINPIIISYYGGVIQEEESCLSIPGLSGFITRKIKIKIHFFDENWKFHVEHFKGLKSMVIQHEYDHLEGTLWIDKIDLKTATKILPDLLKLKKYKTI